MTQTIKFTFEGFEIEAKFNKDSEPPFDVWELDDWNFLNSDLQEYKILQERYDWNLSTIKERIQAACYEALENHSDEDYRPEEE